MLPESPESAKTKETLKQIPLASWVAAIAAMTIVSAIATNQFVLKTKPIAQVAPAPVPTANQNELLEQALELEAIRIRSQAGSDPACTKNPINDIETVNCFLTRLELENQSQLAAAMFRQRALIKARSQWQTTKSQSE